MTDVHASAAVSAQAELGCDVTIGPFCVVEPGVRLGDGCHLASHVVIKSGTMLGRRNELGEGAILGGKPQHLRAGSDFGPLVIGDHNQIREHVTIHRGLSPDAQTTIGDHNLIMVGAHIAHDCHVGDHTIIANNVMMSGHVKIADRAYISGAAGFHQFCRVGRLAMVGGQAHCNQDVPPFVTVDGLSTQIVGLNLVGLKRAGFTSAEILDLKAAYRLIYRSGLLWQDMLEVLANSFKTGPAAEFHPFLSKSQRGFLSERQSRRAGPHKLQSEADEASALSTRRAA